MADIQAIANDLSGLTVMQVAELVKLLEGKWGVSAAAAAPVMVAGGGAAAAGDKKINVIKVVREVTSLGLKEAKDLVDGTPKAVLEKVNKESADKAKAALEGAGATVTVK